MRLRAQCSIDLPSTELFKEPGPIARFFGFTEPKRTGKEALCLPPHAILDQFHRAFYAAGITNALALTVNGRTTFLDRAETDHDIGYMIQSAQGQLPAGEAVREMRMALEHRDQGIHYIFDLHVNTVVNVGQHELRMVVSGRLYDYAPYPHETAVQYRARLRSKIADANAMAPYLDRFKRAVAAVLQQVAIHTQSKNWQVEYAELGVRKPSRTKMATLSRSRFSNYRWGFNHDLQGFVPAYYYDPHEVYYVDPRDAMTDAIMLDALLGNSGQGIPPEAVVYDSLGHQVGTVGNIDGYRTPLGGCDTMVSDDTCGCLDAGMAPSCLAGMDDDSGICDGDSDGGDSDGGDGGD